MPPGRRKPLDLPQTVAGASPTPSPQAVSAFAPFPSLQEKFPTDTKSLIPNRPKIRKK
ncbi:unnamed protein product [Gulo gulo]|uniref:Uncharacterized protein n=1 Tax=Gulo gulo TaxID=48420 RepID=A0A9X9LSE8_GULGU|nr:unnamed protein product [Gulo gulo]